MAEENAAATKRPKTISVRRLLLIILVIILMAIGFFTYLYYTGDSLPEVSLPYMFTQKPKFLFNIYGDKKRLLKAPMTVYVNDDNMIYVANTEGHTVEVFRPNGDYAFSFGGFGKDNNRMSFPYGITGDGFGNILVAEAGNARIQIYTKQGLFIGTLVDKESKIGLQKPGPLFRDHNGNIYIGDLVSQEIIVIDSTGRKLRSLKGVLYPHGIAVDRENRIYVSDSGNYRVAVFDEKGKELNTIAKWGGDMPFTMVRGVALDPYGRVFVADTLVSEIRVFDREYNYMFSFGSKGMENGKFVYPNGMFIDSKGRIYIADWGNNRIQVWGY